MDFESYIQQKKELYSALLDFIESPSDSIGEYNTLISVIEEQSILNNIFEIRELFILISKITNDHYRSSDFFAKIEQLFNYLIKEKKSQITTTDIIQIFKSNKRVLYLLFEKGMIVADDTILNILFSLKDKNDFYIHHYLFPVIKQFIQNEQTKESIQSKILNEYDDTIESFTEKCQIGENDSFLCSLIRQDSVEDFVTYTNRKNLSLEATIKPSLFETNSLLIKNKTSLIEYAAFFGSIQIFQYLVFNQVEESSSLWKFAIHSKNPVFLHLLEDYKIDTDDRNFFNEYIKEAVKCHHNDFVNYIKCDIFKNEEEFFFNIENNYDNNFYKSVFQHHNYLFFPDDLNHKYIFFYLCKYGNLEAVKLYLKYKKVDLNTRIISKTNYFFKLCLRIIFLLIEFN